MPCRFDFHPTKAVISWRASPLPQFYQTLSYQSISNRQQQKAARPNYNKPCFIIQKAVFCHAICRILQSKRPQNATRCASGRYVTYAFSLKKQGKSKMPFPCNSVINDITNIIFRPSIPRQASAAISMPNAKCLQGLSPLSIPTLC